MPANPWTLAAYARWSEHQQPEYDLTKAFKTIFRVHNSKSRKRPDRDPLVVNTLNQIEERAKEKAEQKKRPKDKSRPLFPDDDLLDPKPAPKKRRTAGKAGSPRTKGKDKSPAKRKSPAKKTRKGLSPGPKLVSKRKLKK